MTVTSLDTERTNLANDPLPNGWPRRWHFAVAGCFFLALAIYGSLVPLEYRPLDWDSAVQGFVRLFTEGTAKFSKTDVAVNVLLFVPVAFCFLAALTSDKNRLLGLGLKSLFLLIACTAASMLIEFSQMWFVRRTASSYDVFAQICGTLIGILAWVFAGRSFTDWLRQRSAAHSRIVTLAGVLSIYYGALVLYWMLPLDLTIRPAELWRKYQAGKIGLRPFAEVQDFGAVINFCSHLAAFVPVGMLAVVLFTSQRKPLRNWAGSLILSVFLVAIVWTAGLLAVSHYSSTTQLIAGLGGAVVGIFLTRKWLKAGQHAGEEEPEETGARPDRFWLFVLCGLCYAAFLVAFFCYPEGANKKPITDANQLRERMTSMFRPPLASLWKGSIFNAVKELVRKVGLFLPLGLLMAGAIKALHPPRRVRWTLSAFAILAGLALGAAQEVIQVIIPGHTPDLTDAFLCGIGSAIGVIASLRWKKPKAA